MPVRAVVFDLFDTLVDVLMERLPLIDIGDRKVPSTFGALHELIVQRAELKIEDFVTVMREVDKLRRETLYKEGREYPTLLRFQEVCERLGLDDPEIPEALTRAHMGAIRGQVRYLPHHVELLEGLRAGGLLTGVCSNFSHTPTALEVIEESGLSPHLDAIVISEDVGIRKPRPEIFEETLRRLDVSPAETVHVGDNLDADVSGASALGIRTVWVTRRVDDPGKRLESHKGKEPQHVVSDLGELPGTLEL